MSIKRTLPSTRRKFLLNVSTISLAALASPARILAETAPQLREKNFPAHLNYEAFAAQLKTTFRIHAAPLNSIEVRLDEVRLKPDEPVKPGQRPRPDFGHEKFSLFFVGRREELIKQGVYTFEHDTLGRFDFFTVPVFTRNPSKIDYQIVFNRPRNRAFNPSS